MKNKNQRVKILICGHDLKFLRPLMESIEGNSAYELKILEHSGHHLQDTDAARAVLDWANLIFCEWALGNAVWFSQNKRENQVLIVRLHLQEVQARDRIDFIWKIDWSQVDRLVLITEHLYDWMRDEFPHLRAKTSLVYNPIPAKSAYSRDKSDGSRFVLGFVGAVPARKRVDLALEVLRELLQIDSRYVLRIKGNLPEHYPWMAKRHEEMAWYTNMFEKASDLISRGAVIFDGHGSDMASWYSGIGHIISTSDFEGSHQAVAEGMAAGCVPAIRDWEGASRIYPSRFVRSTVSGLVDLILASTEEKTYIEESSLCREFAARFDNGIVCARLESIMQRELIDSELVESWPSSEALLELPAVGILAYIPIGNRGGYRIRVEQEILALLQLGCRVHLICLMPIGKNVLSETERIEYDRKTNEHIQSFEKLGCKAHLVQIDDFFRMKTSEDSFNEATIEIEHILRKNAIDVLHAEALYCGRVALAAKQRYPQILFSIDWHGVVPEESRMSGAHPARVIALEEAEKNLLTKTDLNIFVSEKMRAHYERKYEITDLPKVIIPCCVSDERFPNTSSAQQAALLPVDDMLWFGYAGTMADWQCGREMLALFSALHRHDNRCKFLLLVPETDHALVRRFATESGLATSAFTLLEVRHDEVPERLQACDVGVLIRADDPVNRVSSPTKFGEYLAAGLPLVMTDCIGDFSELATKSGLAYDIPQALVRSNFETISVEELSAIVAFVKSIRHERVQVMTRCQSLARSILSWPEAANEWIGRYKSLRKQAIH